MACLCGALARVFRPSTHKSPIIIKESEQRELFYLALEYLTHKKQSVKADHLGIEDSFNGKRWKWSLRDEKEKYKKFWIIPRRRKIRSLELSFRNKYRRRVKSYLAYVQEEGRRIKEEKRRREEEKKKLGRECIQTLGSVITVLASVAIQSAIGT